MTTALTVFGNHAASSLATANTLFPTSAGAASASVNTLIGTSSGWGEIYSQGNAGAWPALGAMGLPSGHGWLFDVTTLELQQIIAGNWTPAIRTGVTAGTATADMWVNAYKRSSSSIYRLIGSMSLAAQAFSVTLTNYFFVATALAAMSFASGDKLYLDHWLNITVADGSSASYKIQECTTASQGRANNFQVATPGYIVAPVASTSQIIGNHRAFGRIN